MTGSVVCSLFCCSFISWHLLSLSSTYCVNMSHLLNSLPDAFKYWSTTKTFKSPSLVCHHSLLSPVLFFGEVLSERWNFMIHYIHLPVHKTESKLPPVKPTYCFFVYEISEQNRAMNIVKNKWNATFICPDWVTKMHS